jgi:hypothetical protein
VRRVFLEGGGAYSSSLEDDDDESTEEEDDADEEDSEEEESLSIPKISRSTCAWLAGESLGKILVRKLWRTNHESTLPSAMMLASRALLWNLMAAVRSK